MTFDRLVNMYLIESKKSGPPYIVKNKHGTFYYKDSAHKILHRLDGPACEYLSGMKSWYVDGKRHRLDGPACEWVDSSKQWFVDGKLHRLDGPACEWYDGSKQWWVDGKRHRLDGPAVKRANNGPEEYWIKGKQLTKEEFDEYLTQLDAIDKVSKAGNRLSSELIKGLFD